MTNPKQTPDIDLTVEWDDEALDRLMQAIRSLDEQVIDLTEL